MSYLLEVPVGLEATPKTQPEEISSISSEQRTGRLTQKQQIKQDALDLAELIYDIFKESESSANIGGQNRKDNR